MEKSNLVGGWSPDEIAKAKARHGKLTLVSVEPEGEPEGQTLHFWFKQPDMKIMSAFTKIAQSDPLQGVQVMFKNCLINSEMAKYADDTEVFLSVGEHLSELVKKRNSSSQSF
jgi:hypothetical protein